MRPLNAVAMDVRAGLRALRSAPGFTLVAVTTLALGIGAATALMTLAYAVLLRPLPYTDPDRLTVVVAEQDFQGASQPVRAQWPATAVASWPATGAIERIGFHSAGVAAAAWSGTSELVDVAFVAGDFFGTVDGPFVLGRGLAPSDDLSPAAVISARLWRRNLGGTAGVLGQTITLNAQPHTIVGVAADGFQIPEASTDVWLPAGFARVRNPACCNFNAIARLRQGASPETASAELAGVARRFADEMPRSLAGVRVRLTSLHDAVVGEVRPALLVLTAAVGLLLLLACANVMNLVVARNTARRHEIAVRRALGASWQRLVLQALAESAVLAALGGTAGAALSALSLRTLQANPPKGLPRIDALAIDGSTLLFACLAAAVATLVVGMLPAVQASRAVTDLAAGQRGVAGNRRSRLVLRTVTVAQLAMSVVLLAGAALLGRSLVALLNTDLGVVPDRVATISLNLAMDRRLTDVQQIELVQRVLERIQAIPQVYAAGVGAARPPNASRMRLTLRRSDNPDERASYQAAAVPATPGYFQALGLRLERGRAFTDADTAQAPPVVMMSLATARHLFGDDDPVGRTIGLPVLRDGRSGREEMTVVGLTANVKYSGIDQVADDVVYRPFAQQPWRSVFLVARTTGDSGALAARLPGEITAVDRQIVTADAAALESVLSDATAQPRFRTWLLTILAALAMAIALVGVYGVLTFAASQRRREIGIRMALGADRRRISLMVFREGILIAAAGAAIGLTVAYACAGLLRTLLYGIAPGDPASFAAATLGVSAAALGVSAIPAARAAASDPAAVLRAE